MNSESQKRLMMGQIQLHRNVAAVRLDLMHLTEPLPPVWADADRLRYILINLMSNAVKYSPKERYLSIELAQDIPVPLTLLA